MANETVQGLKVAILVTDGFEEVELTEPRKALDQAGADTRVVSPKGDEVRRRQSDGSRGMRRLGRSPSRANRVEAAWGKFAEDSPLEGDGFELPVPRKRASISSLYSARETEDREFAGSPVAESGLASPGPPQKRAVRSICLVGRLDQQA